MSLCSLLTVDHARVVARVLVGRLNEFLRLVVFMLVQVSLSSDFEVILGMMGWTIGLSIANIMLWLFNSIAQWLNVLVHVIAVHVSKLAAVEGVFRLFVRGLLDDEVDRVMKLVIEDLMNWYLLLHFVSVTMLFAEWLLLNKNPVSAGVRIMFNDMTQVQLAAIVGCGVSVVVLVLGMLRMYCREICMLMVGD